MSGGTGRGLYSSDTNRALYSSDTNRALYAGWLDVYKITWTGSWQLNEGGWPSHTCFGATPQESTATRYNTTNWAGDYYQEFSVGGEVRYVITEGPRLTRLPAGDAPARWHIFMQVKRAGFSDSWNVWFRSSGYGPTDAAFTYHTSGATSGSVSDITIANLIASAP